MHETKISALSSGLIWFGAAVSIAEILTGTMLAPLGWKNGITAILLGHIIGCTLLYLVGLVGARTDRSSMETVKCSFGEKGTIFFSTLNILQLLGWTGVMIASGAKAANIVINTPLSARNQALWCILIGTLIAVWLLAGLKNLGRLNMIAMSILFLATIMLSFCVFHGSPHSAAASISFGAAVELSAAMPLSWLPLISDYIKRAKNPRLAAGVSTGAYFLTSCWMYLIGMGCAIYTGQSDIAVIMLQAGLGLTGILIIIFSTVTTTFLDAFSAGVSFTSITGRFHEKKAAVIVCIAGTLLAIYCPLEQYENFLYLIGSVFAPMAAILLTDHFLLKKDHSRRIINSSNFILWAIGFLIYRLCLSIDTVIGSTLPVMFIICILSILVNGGKNHACKYLAKP